MRELIQRIVQDDLIESVDAYMLETPKITVESPLTIYMDTNRGSAYLHQEAKRIRISNGVKIKASDFRITNDQGSTDISCLVELTTMGERMFAFVSVMVLLPQCPEIEKFMAEAYEKAKRSKKRLEVEKQRCEEDNEMGGWG